MCSVTDHVDFEVSNKTVTIPASRADSAQACDTITVRLLDDQVVEGNETFTIFLESLMDSSRVNISSQGERNVTIIDDDSEFSRRGWGCVSRCGQCAQCFM